MKDMAELLAEYRLTSPNSLARLMRLMGREHLRSFLADLASYGEQERGVQRVPPGHLALFPVGGWLGLGTSAEVARELLLYADHLFLYNDLSEKARELLPRLEEKKFQSQKAWVIWELHPLLFQFFSIRPAWEGQYASFVYPPEVKHSEQHPFASRVKAVFLPLLDYGVGVKSRKPWLQMAIGPRFYLADPKVRMMNPGLAALSRACPNSTRDANLMRGKWTRIGEETEPQDSQALADPEHPLATALDDFISYEIERLERALTVCYERDAHFITDVPTDWAIISALATSTADGMPIPKESSPAFAFDFTQNLAFLEGLPLDRLIGLREVMTCEFENFRGALLRLARTARDANPENRRREAALIVKEELEPAVARLSERIRAAHKDLRDSVGASVVVAALSGFLAFITSYPQLAALGLPLLHNVLASRRQLRKLERDEMYFLLRVREAGDNARNGV